MFKSFVLYTDKLDELNHFYHHLLGLPIIEKADNFFSLRIGTSTLTFKQSEGNSIYHFAFNIPGNHIPSAKRWLSDHVTLNKEDGKNEVYYKSFDADAIYFSDPVGNVVEYIGRRTVQYEGEFSIHSLINISEVGITTPYVMDVGQKIMQLGIPARNEKPLIADSLNFLGMKGTYLVLVPPNRKWYFSEVMSKTSPLEITLTNNRKITLTKGGQLIDE